MLYRSTPWHYALLVTLFGIGSQIQSMLVPLSTVSLSLSIENSPKKRPCFITFSPNGKYALVEIISPQGKRRLESHLIDLVKGKDVLLHKGTIIDVYDERFRKFSPYDTYFITYNNTGKLCLYATQPVQALEVFEIRGKAAWKHWTHSWFSPNERYLVLREYKKKNSFIIYDIHDKKSMQQTQFIPVLKTNYSEIQFSPDGKQLVQLHFDHLGAYIYRKIIGSRQVIKQTLKQENNTVKVWQSKEDIKSLQHFSYISPGGTIVVYNNLQGKIDVYKIKDNASPHFINTLSFENCCCEISTLDATEKFLHLRSKLRSKHKHSEPFDIYCIQKGISIWKSPRDYNSQIMPEAGCVASQQGHEQVLSDMANGEIKQTINLHEEIRLFNVSKQHLSIVDASKITTYKIYQKMLDEFIGNPQFADVIIKDAIAQETIMDGEKTRNKESL